MIRQEDNDRIITLAKDTFGRVDVMFLNAGLMPNSPLSALKTDDWHRMVDVNVKGVLNKSDNERSGVLSTAMSFLGLYRDPTVAEVTSHCDCAASSRTEIDNDTAAPVDHRRDEMAKDIGDATYIGIKQPRKYRLRPIKSWPEPSSQAQLLQDNF